MRESQILLIDHPFYWSLCDVYLSPHLLWFSLCVSGWWMWEVCCLTRVCDDWFVHDWLVLIFLVRLACYVFMMFFQSRGESPAGFINVNFTAFTRDVVNTWMVVRSSPVLICVKNIFKLVCWVMRTTALAVLRMRWMWCDIGSMKGRITPALASGIMSFLWFSDCLVGGIWI